MARMIRSARGTLIDLDLLSIKSQLAAVPVPKLVEDRKRAMDAKDGVKTDQLPDLDFLNVAIASADTAEKTTKVRQASQIKAK